MKINIISLLILLCFTGKLDAQNLEEITEPQNYQQAINNLMLYNKLVEQTHSPDAYYIRAKAYTILGNYKAALKDLKDAQKQTENIKSLLLTTQIYLKMNKTEKAFETLQKALAKFPNDTTLLAQRAAIYEKTRDLTKAEKDYQTLYQITQNTKYAQKLAETYIKEQKYNDAILLLNPLLRQKPVFTLYNLRAKAYQATGYTQKAYYDYTMSVDLNPIQPDIYMEIAQSAYELGYKEQACLYWKKCLEEYKNFEAEKQIKKHCKKILKQN